MKINPLAGKQPSLSMLVDVPKLIAAYYTEAPDPTVASQRVTFGTSGHRGSAFNRAFNEHHIFAMTQAICMYRKQNGITGPLYLGFDTHALSIPAFRSALEVLSANSMTVMIAKDDEYTPTPAISHAILTYNKGRESGLADGIVITPSHNPPHDGGFKYNPPTGGPANTTITSWIEKKANEILETKLKDVKKFTFAKALKATTTHRHDFLNNFINDLGSVVDMKLIKDSKIHIGASPIGGAGAHYWGPLGERYGLNLTVIDDGVDPTFRFMSLDWDGQIRMDPSSQYAMTKLIAVKDKFDIAFACDTDHDRHGIVTKHSGLLTPNHYFSVVISYLFAHRPLWDKSKIVAKSTITSSMLDRVTAKIGRKLYETPVGFKWFVDGLLDGSLGFSGEESAGASFARLDGSVWTTDKDGFAPALLSAEITARLNRDPGEIYKDFEKEFGPTFYKLDDAKATPEQKERLKSLSAKDIKTTDLAGEKIEKIETKASGNNAPIDGVKISTKGGWCAMRPSGTEEIYKIYAESFHNEQHLNRIMQEAQAIVDTALKGK